MDRDVHFMRMALRSAERGLGRVWPNPSVGCVIVKDDAVRVCTRTADGGRPHAEALALAEIGVQAYGATMYVTLEPCAHHGKTAPCVDAIIAAGLSRVVIGATDPDERVNGRGIAALKSAGIEVVTGVLEGGCCVLNEGFDLRVTAQRPLVTLKAACSQDGKITRPGRGERRITGLQAERHVHLTRSRHDAIMVGVGTALVDDPLLTTRIPGYQHDIVRCILDTDLRIPIESQLVKTARAAPFWVFHGSSDQNKIRALQKGGVKLFYCDPRELSSVLALLASEGITRLLVEGGAQVHHSFLASDMWDRLMIYRSPLPIGTGGLDFAGGDIKALSALPLEESVTLGEDLLEIYTRRG